MLPHEASISEAISEAEKAAYEPDEGVEEFAEKLKYTIVSSYLLGSTLSISMYDHRPVSYTHLTLPTIYSV